MPYTLKPNKLFIKDPEGIGFLPQNAITDRTTAEDIALWREAVADITEQGNEAIEEITATGNETIAAAQAAMDSIESQKDTMIESIASIAGQGTDTTLTQTGVAADAKAAGEVGKELKFFEDGVLNKNALLEGFTKTDVGWHVGYVAPSTGVINENAAYAGTYYIYSDLIPCDKSIQVLAENGYAIRYFWWDKQTGEYIAGAALQYVFPHSKTFDDTTRAYRIQFTAFNSQTLEQAQSTIENISDYITLTITTDTPITPDALAAVGMATKSYVDAYFEKLQWYCGYIGASDGSLHPDTPSGSSYWVYSDMIETEYGFKMTSNTYKGRRFMYDKTTGDFVSANGWQNAPYNADLTPDYTYRLAFIIGSDLDEVQSVISNIDNYVQIKQKTSSDVPWISFLPLTDVYVGDVQQRIYFNELARFNPNDGYFSVSASGATYPEIIYTDRYIEINPVSAKTITATISFYYKDALSATKTLTIHVQPAPFAAKKIMFLGDSYTANGGMIKWFKDHNGNNAILYGTRTAAFEGVTYNHEGRGGWTATNYLEHASKGSGSSIVYNPFYNPDPDKQAFDFTYYMEHEGSAFADVEIVNILLGRNSGFPIDNMDKLDIMVASIKEYNPNIIVTLMCDSNLAIDNSGAGAYMQNVHTANKQAHIYNTAFYERYKNSSNVVMCFPGLNLDNIYDFETEETDASIINSKQVTRYTDNVHPWNIPGLGKFGIAYNGLLRNLLNNS